MSFFLSLYQPATLNIDDSIIKSSNVQKLLGVTIRSNFTFEEHINSLCQKFWSKIILLKTSITSNLAILHSLDVP